MGLWNQNRALDVSYFRGIPVLRDREIYVCIYTHIVYYLHTYITCIKSMHLHQHFYIYLSNPEFTSLLPIPIQYQSYYSFFFSYSIFRTVKNLAALSSIHLLIDSVLPVCNQLPALPPPSHKEVLLTLFRLWHIAGPSLLPQAPLILLGFNIPCQVTTTLLHRLPPHPNQALTHGARPASTLLTPTEVASIYQLCLSI